MVTVLPNGTARAAGAVLLGGFFQQGSMRLNPGKGLAMCDISGKERRVVTVHFTRRKVGLAQSSSTAPPSPPPPPADIVLRTRA